MDEQLINEMSFLFFESVLDELGKKLNYDAAVNVLGNSFAKDPWKEIEKVFPMGNGKSNTGSGAVAAFLGA